MQRGVQEGLAGVPFIETMLADWRANKLPLEKCARCVVKAENVASDVVYTCVNCKQPMHISLFSPVAIKEWRNQKRNQDRWRCYECQYPACASCLEKGKDVRPLHAVPHNALVNDKYYCLDCRYPPCMCGERILALSIALKSTHAKIVSKAVIFANGAKLRSPLTILIKGQIGPC